MARVWDEDIPYPSPSNPVTRIEGGGRRGKRTLKNGPSQSVKSQKTDSSSSTRRVGSAAILLERLDPMVQSVTYRNKRTSRQEVATQDIYNCYGDDITLPLEVGSPLFSFASTMIEDPQKRTIFKQIPNDHGRIEWLKFFMDHSKN